MEVTANDPLPSPSGVKQVEFYIDGFLKFTDTDGTDGWKWSFDSSEYPDGNHAVRVRAIDNAGNSGTAQIAPQGAGGV